jgi:hypothetical protein
MVRLHTCLAHHQPRRVLCISHVSMPRSLKAARYVRTRFFLAVFSSASESCPLANLGYVSRRHGRRTLWMFTSDRLRSIVSHVRFVYRDQATHRDRYRLAHYLLVSISPDPPPSPTHPSEEQTQEGYHHISQGPIVPARRTPRASWQKYQNQMPKAGISLNHPDQRDGWRWHGQMTCRCPKAHITC